MLLVAEGVSSSSSFDPDKIVVAKYTYVFPTPPANQYNPPQSPGPMVPLVVIDNAGNVVTSL